MKIFKYPLAMSPLPQTIQMPEGADILHVHEQDDRPTLWAAVDHNAPMVERTFYIIATGESYNMSVEPTEDVWIYIGTVHIGWMVWHVHEKHV